MREIKFRGLDLEKNVFTYGDLIHNGVDAYSRIFVLGIKQDGEYPFEIKPETAGQFTGLKDKNGKEIYEGDILCWEKYQGTKHHSVWIVEFDPFKPYKTWLCSGEEDAIVIGNIYENPELIK